MKLRALAVKGAPKLMIATTDLTTGKICYFSDDGLHEAVSGKLWATNRPSLAMAVATSSAFPPGFAPIEVSAKILEVDQSEMPVSHYLTDGGVFDNLGGRLLEAAGIGESDMIISSAEPRPDTEVGRAFTFLAKRAARSTDILMERVSALESERRPAALQIRLQDDIANSPISADRQHQLRTTRTDLNSFSALEVQCLFYKGYEAACHAFGEQNSSSITFVNEIPTHADIGHWLPIQATEAGLSDVLATLDNSSTISIGSMERKAVGRAALPFVVLFLLYVASGWLSPLHLRGEARRWNESESQRALIETNPWLQAFLGDARSIRASDANVVTVASVESNDLDSAYWTLRPNSFECYVGSKLVGGEIMSCRAFLKNIRGELYRSLPVTNVDDEIRVQVLQPQRGDRLFILLGLSWPGKDNDAELLKNNIVLYGRKGGINE